MQPSCTRAPRGRDEDERRALLERELSGTRDGLADAAPHAAADEREVHRGEDDRPPADRAGAVDRALPVPRLALRVGEPLGVRLRVGEAKHVERLDLAGELLPRAVVEELLQPLPNRQPEVEVALRADAERPSQPLVVDERVAGRALRPLDHGLRCRRGCHFGRHVRRPTLRRVGDVPRERASVSSTCSREGASRPLSPKTRATIMARMSVVRPWRSMRVASTARSSARRQDSRRSSASIMPW